MGLVMDPIRVEGLSSLQRSLKALGPEFAKQLRPALNEAAEVVVKVARPLVPVRTGKGRASIKVNSTAKEARVAEGGNRAPYMPWLDYGGTTGRGHSGKSGNRGFSPGSVHRPFLKEGRYVYPAYRAQHGNILRLLQKRLDAVAEKAGLEVSP